MTGPTGHTTMDGPCLIEDCTRDRYSRGLCNAHYKRERKAGRLDLYPRVIAERRSQPAAPMSLAERLDWLRIQDAAALDPGRCRRGCCWTPYGHSTAAVGCTCHFKEAA